MLAGEEGFGCQRAMELLVALGKIYDADRLIPIVSAHLSGVSYKTMGEGGLLFLKELSGDARVTVPTTLNPAGMDLQRWRGMGVDANFAAKQIEIITCYSHMGVETTCTCTPYVIGNLPGIGEHVAWAESSALSFINSAVGAMTNREGGPGALAAAIVGATPEYGLHLKENRAATIVIEVGDIREIFDLSLLGQAVGPIVGGGIPYFRGIHPELEGMKLLAAAMAASGSVAMFHVEGLTPESDEQVLDGLEAISIGRRELDVAKESLQTADEPELIALGCPHLTVKEVRELAKMLEGKQRVKDVEVWFCTSRSVRDECTKEVEVLERFGKVVCDTCMVVAPIEDQYSVTGTNSAKACNYLPTLCSQKVVCASARELLEGLM